MPHNEGQRVEYLSDDNQKCQGTVRNVQSRGQGAMYTIENEQNQQKEEVPENRIKRDLKLPRDLGHVRVTPRGSGLVGSAGVSRGA